MPTAKKKVAVKELQDLFTKSQVLIFTDYRGMSAAYCLAAPTHPLHGPYHDLEYGFPAVDEAVLFERLMLEINQAGLSWLTVLRKRAAFRAAVADSQAAQPLQRWTSAHSPSARTQTAIASIAAAQPAARSPGTTSRWRLHRQLGQ